MKRSINYKLAKSRKIYASLLVVVIILELLSFVLVEQKKEKVVDDEYSIKKKISLNNIIKELEKNEIDVVTMNKKNKGYEFKVVVVGSKEEIKKKVDELDNFNISNYELDVKDKLIKGTLTISTIS